MSPEGKALELFPVLLGPGPASASSLTICGGPGLAASAGVAALLLCRNRHVKAGASRCEKRSKPTQMFLTVAGTMVKPGELRWP